MTIFANSNRFPNPGILPERVFLILLSLMDCEFEQSHLLAVVLVLVVEPVERSPEQG